MDRAVDGPRSIDGQRPGRFREILQRQQAAFIGRALVSTAPGQVRKAAFQKAERANQRPQ
jgi:hypothetical protein